jgi:chitinase
MVADAFDQNFWTANFAAGGTPLTRPAAPAGVTHWGLRTLWCYWIDNHSKKIEDQVSVWLSQARTILQGQTGGSSNVARNFLQNQMSGNGLATVANMHLPRAGGFAAIPLPGNPGSATTTASRYMMWGNNEFGQLGV